MPKENSQAEEWVCIVLANPVWCFVPGERRVTEMLMEKKEKNLKGMRTVFLTASIELGLGGVFLKYLFPAH